MLGHELKQYQLEDCIAIVDADGSGSVDFEEFLDLMRMQKSKKLSGFWTEATKAKLTPPSLRR